MEKTKGGCGCGGVSVEVTHASRGLVSANHSKELRSWTGAPFWLALLMPSSTVEVQGSSLKRFQDRNLFCGECGTPIGRERPEKKTVELNMGIFPSLELEPKYHIFCSQAMPQVLKLLEGDGLERFEEAPGAQPQSSPPQQAPPQAIGSSMHERQESKSAEPKTFLRVQYPHSVNEEDPQFKPHKIISVPVDAIVELVSGNLDTGLPPPYSDYVEVAFHNKVGKVSRQVLVKAVNYAPHQGAHQHWGSNHITVSKGLSPSFSKIPDEPPTAAMGSMNLQSGPPPALRMQQYNSSSSFGSTAVPHPTMQPMPQPMQAMPAQPSSSSSSFIPSLYFQGQRPGFTFTTGPQGTGYYPDAPPPPVFQNSMTPPGVSREGPPGVGKRSGW